MYGLLLYFVWSGPNAVIRSTFPTKRRKGSVRGLCDEDDDSDDDKGLAVEDTGEDRGRGFSGESDEVVGGDGGRGQQSFRIGEMIGGWTVVLDQCISLLVLVFY